MRPRRFRRCLTACDLTPTGGAQSPAPLPKASPMTDIPYTPRNAPGLLRQIVNARWDYMYVAPAMLVMLNVIAYPVYFTIDMSFYKTPPSLQLRDRTFVGLANYTRILTSPAFWDVTRNTIIWTFACTFFAFVLGLFAALALHREFMGRGVLRALLLIPYVVSAVAAWLPADFCLAPPAKYSLEEVARWWRNDETLRILVTSSTAPRMSTWALEW